MKKIKNVFDSQIFSKYKALLAFLFLILLFQQVIFAQSVTTITITKYLGYVPLLLVMFYGLVGLKQLVKEKNIRKVDKSAYIRSD